MHFSKFTFLLIGLFSFFALITPSCKTKKSKDNSAVIHQDSLANFPYWIAMMNDPNTNYYEAVEAFEKYWEHREKPTEDSGEAKDIFEKEKSEVCQTYKRVVSI